jgi:hypothetical protein
MATKRQFEAALARVSLSTRAEPRIELDGDCKYECFDDVDGNEVAFIAWQHGKATYHVVTKMKARIYEDNAGGIHYVTDAGQSTNTDTPTDGNLIADLVNLQAWLDDSRAERPNDADLIDFDGDCFGPYGAKLIAEYNGRTVTLHIDRLGAAGTRYLGVKQGAA